MEPLRFEELVFGVTVAAAATTVAPGTVLLLSIFVFVKLVVVVDFKIQSTVDFVVAVN